jgi:hypothetical protein
MHRMRRVTQVVKVLEVDPQAVTDARVNQRPRDQQPIRARVRRVRKRTLLIRAVAAVDDRREDRVRRIDRHTRHRVMTVGRDIHHVGTAATQTFTTRADAAGALNSARAPASANTFRVDPARQCYRTSSAACVLPAALAVSFTFLITPSFTTTDPQRACLLEKPPGAARAPVPLPTRSRRRSGLASRSRPPATVRSARLPCRRARSSRPAPGSR